MTDITASDTYSVTRLNWCVAATKGDICAAELLSIFIWHKNSPKENSVLTDLRKRAVEMHGEPLLPTKDWQPYSASYLNILLLRAHGVTIVSESLKKLAGLGFISTDAPKQIAAFYSLSHLWIKLDTDALQRWIDENWETSPDRLGYYTLGKISKAVKSQRERTKELNQKISAIGEYYKHVHRKNSNFVFDDKRKKRVKEALINCDRSVGQCVQAVIGIIYADWYQGQNNNNRVFDDITVVFKSATNTEKFIDIASENGITEENALQDFQAFIQGKPSRYRKAEIKDASNAQDRAQLPQGVSAQIEKQCRAFAHSIAGFFFTGVDVKELLEMCETNIGLREQGKDLVEAEFLKECLVNAGKTHKSEISSDVETAMGAFAEAFCELRELNRE